MQCLDLSKSQKVGYMQSKPQQTPLPLSTLVLVLPIVTSRKNLPKVPGYFYLFLLPRILIWNDTNA